jgi:hypothetical protein
MIQVIDGKRYNTEKAELIFHHWNGRSTSDFGHRSKKLYLTKNGNWFMHHIGGARTDMAVSVGSNGTSGSESIEPVDADDAHAFLEAHSEDPDALKALEQHFADKIVDA